MEVKIIKKYLKVVFVVLGVFFLFIQGIIFTQFNSKISEGEKMDYIIILGARVVKEKPSKALNERIKAATKYLKENSTTKVIATGGLGNGATITEAEAIKRQLILNGIDEKRIILEDKSKNTEENLNLSFSKIREDKKISDISQTKIAIVTNNFHMFRAKKIAKKLGYENIFGISAKTPLISTPKAHIRETLSIIKFYILK